LHSYGYSQPYLDFRNFINLQEKYCAASKFSHINVEVFAAANFKDPGMFFPYSDRSERK